MFHLKRKARESIQYLIIDAIGLKVFSEGE